MVGYPSDSIYENKMTERFHLGGYDIDVHRASPLPCPVCGHPTGDCTGENGPEPPDHISGYNSIESLNETQTYLVEEEVTARIREHQSGRADHRLFLWSWFVLNQFARG